MKEFHDVGFFKNKFNISNDLENLKKLLNQQNPERNQKKFFFVRIKFRSKR